MSIHVMFYFYFLYYMALLFFPCFLPLPFIFVLSFINFFYLFFGYSFVFNFCYICHIIYFSILMDIICPTMSPNVFVIIGENTLSTIQLCFLNKEEERCWRAREMSDPLATCRLQISKPSLT